MGVGARILRGLTFGWGRRAAWAVLILFVALQSGLGPIFDTPRLALFDFYQRTLPRYRDSDPVKIVAIDNASLAAVGQWPWPRQIDADLIKKILDQHPAALGIDLLWSEPDRQSPEQFLKQASSLPREVSDALRQMPSHDSQLSDALAAGPVAIGLGAEDKGPDQGGPLTPVRQIGGMAEPGKKLPDFSGALRSIPELDRAAPGHGLLAVAPDMDGVYRRLPMFSTVAGHLVPSFSLETLRLAAQAPTADLYLRGHAVQGVGVGELKIPTQADGSIWVNFSPRDDRRFVSAADVLSGKIAPDAFDQRVVLIGVTGLGQGSDMRMTPLGLMHGTEIHAQLLENIIVGNLARRPGWAAYAEPLLTLILGVILIVVLPRLKRRWQGPAALLPLALLAVLGFELWRQNLLLVDVATPAIGQAFLLLAFLGGSFAEADVQRRLLRQQREFIQNSFSRYVSPQVVERLISDPSKLSLGGDRREMTFLFSDIQNFTDMSETMDSKELAPLLNAYLDGMTRIVHEHEGMVDKFIGDAVFAIFNAPLDVENHAEKAVRCQLALDTFTQQFKAEKNTQGIPFGDTRIGVHTGIAVVGNFGSNSRLAYTASGNAVNTAARLEGLNKHFGTRLCTTKETRAHCKDIRFRPIAKVVVKGKTEAIDVWEPLHDDSYPPNLLSGYQSAFDALDRESPDAGDMFRRLAEEFPDDPLSSFHSDRLSGGATGLKMVMTEK